MMNKKSACVLGSALAAIGFASALQAQNKPIDIVTVVKITGISWFNRMEVGVKEFAAANPGVTTRQIGPAQSDAAQQQRLVEDLVAKKVDAIAVVSMDPPTLEPVLKRALDRGIKVVTHEADNQKNTLVDIEAFDNTAYGARLNDRLAACMGETGKWSSLVGSLGSQSQVQWADGGASNAAKKYPKMTLVDAKNESANDAEKAYAKAKEILRKHPDIKGFQGSSSLDVLGIGRAVEEAGLQGKVCVYGTGLPSEAAKFLESGAVGGIAFWDPKDAGLAMNKAAMMLVQGKKITDGMDLGIPGYNKVSVKKGPGVGVIVTGQAWVEVDKKNYKQYAF
ncbi:substrate-binding domain-containing protein [Herbaspirillum huttiense]|jgi:simple sugar transport system substrate-binding protein|uniref:Substrate-binding domain-containing protein n=5 Tax=Pseudomonadota TaxID=1224 RepID=A0AAJ2HF25_9BURK|nr:MULTISPECIES: substrate-binding domain-containing protein [Herbaspirillum]MBW9334809.1 autoinducer 2 ABC transporter substrate-binding protein [Herbaspirillum sp. RU 5E]MAF04558.1 autoinducer 2 ABC transporter substrate-binding protein [Herbaspirillum sp.]MBN9357114.1 substrate-binding domain-containing protein [Herbaspirillum huttiense]MBO15985.1 autoinducer 2 ABC transporter substrate-binding protein [Herbaspirillum sp.]MBP1315302.1 simple sugar transport system substrate-binding protein |tara:strand:+ start:1159 stop:2166 length:1008 start_codon:yes stop_codon:yes gene_type:complete